MAQTTPRGWTLLLGTVLIGIAMHAIHEVAHVLAAMAFGVEGSLGLNTVRFSGDLSDTASLWTNFAGPAITLAMALAAVMTRWRWAASAAFIAFYQRALAAVMTAIAAPNDEARIGELLGLGAWPVFAVTIGAGLALLIWQVRRERPGWAWLGLSYVGASLAIAIMVFGDLFAPRIAF